MNPRTMSFAASYLAQFSNYNTDVDHDYQEESPLDKELISLLKEFDNPVADTALKRIRKQNLEIIRLKKEISNLTKRAHIK